MCRVLGVVFTKEFPLGTLNDLRHVSEVGIVPGEPERGHNDGWGIVSFASGSPRYIGRSPRPMRMDPSFDAAITDVRKLDSPNILIAHARAASKGGPKMENTHPFIVGEIVLAHNGTVQDLRPPLGAIPKGESDSEILALLVSDRLRALTDLRAAIKSVIVEEILHRSFSAAVMLVSNGKTLYGYRDYGDPSKSDYYDLKIARCDDYVAIYQETLMEYPGDITQVQMGELVSVSEDLTVERELVH